MRVGVRSSASGAAPVVRAFAEIDRGNLEGFLECLTDDVRFAFGNAPVLTGKDSIRGALIAFLATVKRIEHVTDRIWRAENEVICNGRVRYLDASDHSHDLPFANVYVLREGRICDYRIHMDASALNAATYGPAAS
jgi:ketosteroid isomerase-like protein